MTEQTPPTASYTLVTSKQPASKQPAKHREQKGPKGHRGLLPNNQPLPELVPHCQLPLRELLVYKSSSVYNDVRVPRVRVGGACRVWGTMSHTIHPNL